MNHFARLFRRSLACAALACSLGVGAAGAQALAAPVDEKAFAAANAAYDANHWADAYVAFAALADRGDAESARIAMQMWWHGQALYGRGFDVTPAQIRHWWLLLKRREQDECAFPFTEDAAG